MGHKPRQGVGAISHFGRQIRPDGVHLARYFVCLLGKADISDAFLHTRHPKHQHYLADGIWTHNNLQYQILKDACRNAMHKNTPCCSPIGFIGLLLKFGRERNYVNYEWTVALVIFLSVCLHKSNYLVVTMKCHRDLFSRTLNFIHYSELVYYILLLCSVFSL